MVGQGNRRLGGAAHSGLPGRYINARSAGGAGSVPGWGSARFAIVRPGEHPPLGWPGGTARGSPSGAPGVPAARTSAPRAMGVPTARTSAPLAPPCALGDALLQRVNGQACARRRQDARSHDSPLRGTPTACSTKESRTDWPSSTIHYPPSTADPASCGVTDLVVSASLTVLRGRYTVTCGSTASHCTTIIQQTFRR